MSFKVSGSLAEQIAGHLQDRIISLEIKPGDWIRELSVAEELGISRSPVREALRILEKYRMVEIIPRRGAVVTEMTPEFIRELHEVLIELLGYTGRKCTENATQEDLAKIEEAAQRSRTCSQNRDLYGYYRAVIDFGLACLTAARNRLAEQIISELLPSIRRIMYISFATMGDSLIEDAEIITAGNRYVQERNGEMAEKTVRDYISKLQSYVLPSTRESESPQA
ncbi:MAG: GntR family transcriptional regulator [Thermodesulfobacteriota bacterium]